MSHHPVLEVQGYPYSIREHFTYSASRPVPPFTYRFHVFDNHTLLQKRNLDLDFERLRTAFVVYGAMNRKDWRTVTIEDVYLDSAELAR